MKNKRIFIGLGEIAGYYSGLALGLRSLGHDVKLVGASAHAFKYYNNDSEAGIIRLYDTLKNLRHKPQKNILEKAFSTTLVVLMVIVKIVLFIWVIFRCDVFIFSFGTTFFPGRLDLYILRALKKKIICNVAHGSEARPPYINGGCKNPATGELFSASELIKQSNKIKKNITIIEKLADIVIGAPLSAHFLMKKCINSAYLGIPVDFTKFISLPSIEKTGRIRVLHSPSNPRPKGTHLIRKAISSLIDEKYPIDYIEIINQPNHVVMTEIQKCDFIVDQVYSDTPMAGFATEAAMYSKPAVVGGYGWGEYLKYVPENKVPPSQTCHPDDLKASIALLINNEDYRLDLGKKAFTFISQNWDAIAVAKKYLQLINGNFPEEGWMNPNQIIYVNGAGISIDKVKNNIKNMIAIGGIKSLHLSDKPNLESAFREFSEEITSKP